MIEKKINVLVFPAGSEIGLEIFNSLKYNLHIELFGASGKADHARYIYDENHYAEDDFYINHPDFIDTFNTVLTKFKIDFIFPTHDSIVLFLAKHQAQLKAKVLTSSYETTLIAREKILTYNLFKKFDFCPQVYESPYENVSYPVFLKPNIGQGGKGTFLVNNKEELLMHTKSDQDLIACEFLPGDELSIDCFSNKNGELLFIGPRVRSRIQMGISFNTSTVPLTSEIKSIAEKLNETLKFRGAWFFQLKKDKRDKYKLMEFAARQSSTMALYRQTGINFALLSIFDAKNIDVKILSQNFSMNLDRCLFNRYKAGLDYNRVYIDFDDTIIVENKVNLVAMQYLYQCKNNNVKICLLTKHRYDLDESLAKYCLAKNLFDEIILLKSDEDKVKFINPEKSIFIDNYYFDREVIYNELKIPVFDVDAIECLLK
jgi:hypothetical protein